MTATTELLRMAIPFGKENAINRKALANTLGVNDREMRDWISKAREEGVFICNDGEGEGYYIANDKYEILRRFRVEKAREESLSRTNAPMEEYLLAEGLI